jgi:Cu(I)/Ag(I) efflux system protein CusF
MRRPVISTDPRPSKEFAMKLKSFPLTCAALAGLLVANGNAWSAAQGQDTVPKSDGPAASAASPAMIEGEVRKIDKENQKITIKHGEIKNLGMPSMTMVFRVKDPAVLDRLQPGDKVRFVADRINGAIVVTQIEPAE